MRLTTLTDSIGDWLTGERERERERERALRLVTLPPYSAVFRNWVTPRPVWVCWNQEMRIWGEDSEFQSCDITNSSILLSCMLCACPWLEPLAKIRKQTISGHKIYAGKGSRQTRMCPGIQSHVRRDRLWCWSKADLIRSDKCNSALYFCDKLYWYRARAKAHSQQLSGLRTMQCLAWGAVMLQCLAWSPDMPQCLAWSPDILQCLAWSPDMLQCLAWKPNMLKCLAWVLICYSA